MRFFAIALILLSVVLAERHGIIIAPKANWGDYGVQSEACRMYDDMIKAGVKKENIVVMSTDTQKDNPRNPIPDKIFTDDDPEGPGKDYAHPCYEGIDYEAEYMTGKIMLAIMRGDVEELKKLTKIENPRALKSGPEDDIMMYFTSHGGPGSISVGSTSVSKKELEDTIKYMHDNKMYKNFLILLEACYSGSMFVDLPAEWNVYAIAASDDKHSSYCSHCPPHEVIDGKSFGTCLSCYWDNSVEWYIEGGSHHTLDELWQHSHDKVAEDSSQNVSKYGDIERMGGFKIEQFLGPIPADRFRNVINSDGYMPKYKAAEHVAMWKAIRSSNKRDVDEYARVKLYNAKKEITIMRYAKSVMSEVAVDKSLRIEPEVYDMDCIGQVQDQLLTKCGYSAPFSPEMINLMKGICLPGLRVPELNADICV